MSRYSDIVHEINSMQPVLMDCALTPFGRTGSLRFGDGATIAILELTGIHFIGTRQSLLGWRATHKRFGRWDVGLGIDCGVDYFDIMETSKFLDTFLRDDLGLPGSEIVYDTSDRTQEEPDFERPVHVCVCCDEGFVDVICEGVLLKNG